MKKVFKKMKSGFTLVELVVVIAIIAILGTVSVVGYFAFIEKANKSVDESLCTQYNTLLKAESVNDDDITLAEFVTLIEENGINSNHFETLSKDYVFAYHKIGNKCVLLDRATGDVQFPTAGEVIPATELWSTLGSGFRTTPKVANYTLFKSDIYSETFNATLTDYTIDLNNHCLRFDAEPSANISLVNGTLVKTGPAAGSQKITNDTTVKVIDKAEKVIIKETTADIKTELKKLYVDQQTVTIQDKYIGYSGDEHSTYEFSKSGELQKQTTKLVFKNCVFDGMKFQILSPTTDLDLEYDHCEFYNIPSNPLHLRPVKNLYVHDCLFSDCNRGIAFSMPLETARVENNTFVLNKIVSDKGERKDNAIQFCCDKAETNFDNWSTTPTLKAASSKFKVTIKGNVLVKAQALLTVHVGWTTQLIKTEQRTAVQTLLLTDPHFEINSNTLNGAAKIVKDPGLVEDVEKMDGWGQKDYDSAYTNYNTIYNLIEGFIK